MDSPMVFPWFSHELCWFDGDFPWISHVPAGSRWIPLDPAGVPPRHGHSRHPPGTRWSPWGWASWATTSPHAKGLRRREASRQRLLYCVKKWIYLSTHVLSTCTPSYLYMLHMLYVYTYIYMYIHICLYICICICIYI